MSIGTRRLTVLGEFKPFSLATETVDGKSAEDSQNKFDYFLFDSAVGRQKDGTGDCETSCSSKGGDHEISVRGNQIIWATGSQVYKRFTLPSPVIKVCWCMLSSVSEAFLCVLQSDSLTIYGIEGEVAAVSLPRTVTSIWPLPFGLLLQNGTKCNPSAYAPFSSSSPSSSSRDISRTKREIGCNALLNMGIGNTFGHATRADGTLMSSHMILRDPLEEPQSSFIEERGKMNIMREFEENTIWTSNRIPLMASYNKGKLQHSLWVADAINSNHEPTRSKLCDLPIGVLPKQFSFRRIWQGKGAQSAANKVFLATDDDASTTICFLLQEQKKLLSLRLQIMEINDEFLVDVKPDMSWSLSAIAAEPVIVTRPRVKVGPFQFFDIIILTPENTLLLYSGRQCLCKYLLPPCLDKIQLSENLVPSWTPSTLHDMKITGLLDAVDERINVKLSNGKVYRCALQQNLSSLANDCISAMAVGLSSRFYNQFLILLWASTDLGYPSEVAATVDNEWYSYSNAVMKMCGKSSPGLPEFADSSTGSAWDFLISSDFHKNYNRMSIAWSSAHTSHTSCLQFDTMQNSHNPFYHELLMETLDALHAVYESLKLDNIRKRDLGLLVVLLCDVADFLGEECYLDYYIRDFPGLSSKFLSQSLFCGHTPPSIFRWLESCVQHGPRSMDTCDLPPLIFDDRSTVLSWARKIVSFYSLLFGSELSGKKLSSGVYCSIASGSSTTCEERTVLAMVGEGFGLRQLDLLPEGVSLPLRHALDKCRESPPTDWPPVAYVLLGREDLAWSRWTHSWKLKEFGPVSDMNLFSMSSPYMLHLLPVTIPPLPDTTGQENTRLEDADMVNGSSTDGMDHIFSSSTQLRYGRDLRLNEARRLLCSARPVVIQTSINTTASDQDLQQAQLWQLAQRTTSLPLGRGAFTLATTTTLLTEALTVPKLVLAGRLPAQQNATVNLDPSIRNIQELKIWPEFHNAVAAGLMLAPIQGKMSRTWIIYNQPDEANVTHAGLLLAMGLHGHLQVLTITDIYQYYSQGNESTTVGLMLGLAASYRGTMEPAISKSFYVHVPARHPSSFPDLELSSLLQPAALMSIGLLYEGSMHPQTMQILLSEIGRRSGVDNVLESEGYAVSAGFALGLVGLGRGQDVLGFMDTLIERLFHYAGGKESRSSQNRSVSLTFSGIDQNHGPAQTMDGALINIDITAPGAIIALGLMFLKTESEMVASRLSIPHTQFSLQYVRPDFIMLRVIAWNLVLWSRVTPSKSWIQSQIPDIVKNGLHSLEASHEDDIDAESLVQAYVNIVAGACLSIGLKFAGTYNGDAQELLNEYAVYFLNEIKPVSSKSVNNMPKGLAKYVDRGTLEICLHLTVLSLSVVMAGSGDLQTLRLLRYLRNRSYADGHTNYGTQMAVSLAVGFLFLGGGVRTFSTSNSSIAALLIALYPRLPMGPNDNRCHLQAFRHLYVLATEARWVQTIDVDTGLPVYAPLEVTIKETDCYSETTFCEITPCLLPERAVLKTVRICGPRYWPQLIELIPEEKPWWCSTDRNDPFNSGIIYIKRRVGVCSYVDDPVGCQSLLSQAMHKVVFKFKSSDCSKLKLEAANSSNPNDSVGAGAKSIEQLVSAFSSDPSLNAFAQLCSDPAWNNRSDIDFQEFCLQVLFECVSKDKPTLLQVYLSFYSILGSMADQVQTGHSALNDSTFISSLKLALAYKEALLNERLINPKGGIIQSVFIGSMRKRVDELFENVCGLQNHLSNYLRLGKWPSEDSNGCAILSWYLQWNDVPSPYVLKTAVEKARSVVGASKSSSLLPILNLLIPRTQTSAMAQIDKILI
ncbi:anaphase-promoting complex subunit 1 [Impatiens glandulifera]|uniref:anaphase-promoting complex subunit 1 n=1 Tax=Impatiens glandulifera TaxID=253017 RepID=UPI001FB05B33|nr:anaphase-promoting complex subunit 1 [Impatiens glandulifera]